MKIQTEKTEGVRYKSKCVCGVEITGKDEKTFFSNLKSHELLSKIHIEHMRKKDGDETGDVAPMIQ